MKAIYSIYLSLFLLSFSVKAEVGTMDASQNELLPLKEFEGRIDQSVVFNANDDGKPDYVLLLKPSDPTKSLSQELLVFISNGSSYKQILKLPSYWNRWGSAADDSSAPKLELSGNETNNLLIVKITDSYDDAANQLLKFRWEKNNFHLIGETKSASPRDSVKTKAGDDVQGRWIRSKDINWLTGNMIVKCDLKSKIKSARIKPKYITIADYEMDADYLDGACH